ncbi:cell division initiation protein [Streptomyces sp. B6B3]|uniref:cell division initiation protein n=1 Tax=Streptomyces sp. B6B3 TaxID=3153570 RepID=UPI00325E6F63
MDVQQKLDEIVTAVQGAKGMPMSASCVINRTDLLTSLAEVREALPGSLAEAREVLGAGDQVVAEAQAEAQRIVEAAHAERGSLVEGTAVAQQAQAEASRILAEARREAAEVKAEADDYVDSKLANFEVVLGKTIGSVDRGREKLLGPDRGDPQELLQRADAYVDAQFTAIEAVLRKTLEAVGRGRQKLTGHRPIDELAEHVAAQDEQAIGLGQGAEGYFDASAEQDTYDYLGVPQPQQPQPEVVPPAPGYPAQDPYPAAQPAAAAYGQQEYGQDGYAGGYAPAATGYEAYSVPAQQPDPYAQQAHQVQGVASGYGYQDAQPGYQGAAALDETSFFDTGMLDAEQLRRYEQGQH